MRRASNEEGPLPLSVVILAAGQGKRMHSDLPKVLQPLAGRPLLAHVIDTARALEPAAIHIVYGHGGDRVRQAFPESDLRWCLQAEQLGTGHAVAQALPEIPDGHAVLVLCGDVPLVRAETLRRLVGACDGAGVALLTAVVDPPTGYGRVLRDMAGRVTRIVEERDATDAERRVNEINTGLMAMNAANLRRWIARLKNDNAQGEYYLTDVIAMAFDEGLVVRGEPTSSPLEAVGINDKAQLAAAERAYQRLQAERLMAQGVTIADPSRIDIRGTVEAGRDVFLDVGVVLEGRVVLGDRVRIGAYSVVQDASLGADCTVHPHSVVQGLEAAGGCELGPFARIRPGTVLAEGVKIGNFVETKKARIAARSKVNHLSYVGDAHVGADVNIGAGTITCNYDGANKHLTVIGDNAFIGSNTALVAPVEIGEGATIGAGSTITKNAPAGELTVARSRQTTIEGWKRPVKNKK
ncbi:MAG: bifunctional UDP-N-acetylglucosamine diphosphorylase/glucosamine-1-phosphate N-acetyltransferase GlmU [Gammaproteobacteria bacterium]